MVTMLAAYLAAQHHIPVARVGFTGIAIHDAYSGYDGFTTATHARCEAEATGSASSTHMPAPTAGPNTW
jgi:hypothetical protein